MARKPASPSPDKLAAELPAPTDKAYVIHWFPDVERLGVRITRAGARSYVYACRPRGLGYERVVTVGRTGDWKYKAALDHAKAIQIRARRDGYDPIVAADEQRQARAADIAEPTIDTLCDRFIALHVSRRRPATQRDYKSIIRLYIRPRLGKLKVKDVAPAHVEALFRHVEKRASTRANRVMAVGSSMFSFGMKTPAVDPVEGEPAPPPMCLDRTNNPFKGVERNPERQVKRYLTRAEIDGLMKALAGLEDEQGANVIRLLTLTGARKGQLLQARWSDIDLMAGVWVAPGATTKQKTDHVVYLSEPARELLRKMQEAATKAAREAGKPLKNDAYVFPGRVGGGHRTEIRNAWMDACKAAAMVRLEPKQKRGGEVVVDKQGEPVMELKTTARVHDLRHTFASLLVSGGASLPLIGSLLGHTQVATTQRYAHLFDDPQRQAADAVAALVMPTAKPKDPAEQ